MTSDNAWTQLSRRGVCLALAAAVSVPIGLSPGLATAAAIGPAAESEMDEAKRLYDEGLAHFETHDYERAVEKWTLAYSKLPDDAAGQKNAMVYNIATAQEKAYDLDKDVQHLRQAQLLLESYVKTYKAMFAKTPETKAEVDKANARIQALRDKIAAAEQGTTTAAATTPDEIQWTAPEVDKELLAHNQQLSEQSRKATGFIIAGWSVGGTGLLVLLGGVGSVAGGTTADARVATWVGVTAIVLGAGAVATGGALLGIGYKKRKATKEGRILASPMLAPGFAGVGISGRF